MKSQIKIDKQFLTNSNVQTILNITYQEQLCIKARVKMDTTTALLKKGKVQMRRVIGLSSTIQL